ncbi:MAG TPA: hypothetical protein VFB81_15310 [Myxococcales bacterium]|nr:hypothetical protein [Myxococcales bacterium]
MFSPVSQLQNLWQLAHMLSQVGAAAQPAQPLPPQQPQTGGAPAPVQPGDTFQPSGKDSRTRLNDALASNPAAQAALQSLENRGKLKPNEQGKNALVDQLSRLSGQPELLGQVVQDLAHPGKMKQGKDNKFCAQTATLSDLARESPARYARVAADLALNGSSKVLGGATLTAQKDLDQSKMGSMSATQKLMAPALAEYANGAGMEVDAKGVSHATDARKTNRTVAGTFSTGMEKMQQAVLGHDWDSQYIDDSKKGHKHSVDSAERTIHSNLKDGETPQVSRNGHWFNVTGFRATPDGGRMTIQDPLTGDSRTVNARHFLNNAEAVTFDKTERKPDQELMAKPKKEKPGGGGNAAGSGGSVEDRC